jgi:hypothetical protein
VLQKQLISENPVPTCHLCEDMITKLLVEADGKDEMKAIIEKYKAEFSSLTTCDDDGTPRWELMGFQRKCWKCDAAYMQKEAWQDDIQVNEAYTGEYDKIETIYKSRALETLEEKNGNCLCSACVNEYTSTFIMSCARCTELFHDNELDYVPDFPNDEGSGDEFQVDRDLLGLC